MNTIQYGQANNLNQYPSVDSDDLVYDNNGCLTDDGTNTYAYDHENRLVSVTTDSGTVNFKYDPFGRLVLKTVGSNKFRYLYSGMQRIEEYNGNTGALLKRYVWGAGLDECLFVVDATTGDVTYLHADEIGSTILTTDETGTPINRNVYSPWGELTTGSLSDISVGYTGQFYEADVDLYFYKARHYSPKLGRFLQPDPIGYKGGLNLYEYCGSDPVNFTDPLGQDITGVIIYAGRILGSVAMGGAAAGGAASGGGAAAAAAAAAAAIGAGTAIPLSTAGGSSGLSPLQTGVYAQIQLNNNIRAFQLSAQQGYTPPPAPPPPGHLNTGVDINNTPIGNNPQTLTAQVRPDDPFWDQLRQEFKEGDKQMEQDAADLNGWRYQQGYPVEPGSKMRFTDKKYPLPPRQPNIYQNKDYPLTPYWGPEPFNNYNPFRSPYPWGGPPGGFYSPSIV